MKFWAYFVVKSGGRIRHTLWVSAWLMEWLFPNRTTFLRYRVGRVRSTICPGPRQSSLFWLLSSLGLICPDHLGPAPPLPGLPAAKLRMPVETGS